MLFESKCLYLRTACYFTHIRQIFILACERHADLNSRGFCIQQIYNFVAMFANMPTSQAHANGSGNEPRRVTQRYGVYEQLDQPTEKLTFPKLLQCCVALQIHVCTLACPMSNNASHPVQRNGLSVTCVCTRTTSVDVAAMLFIKGFISLHNATCI